MREGTACRGAHLAERRVVPWRFLRASDQMIASTWTNEMPMFPLLNWWSQGESNP
jgi:hypothetical protein